jgi:FkbM family methyltransferase
MDRRLTRIGRSLLGRLGYDVTGLYPGAAVVRRRARDGAPEAKRPEWILEEQRIFEYLERAQIPTLLDMYGVNCVIDVGAHAGQYGERLRAGGYGGRIVSFEPTPAGFEELERAASADPKWSVHRLALGREDGTTTMNAVPGTLSSILEPTKFGAGRYPKLQQPEQIEVEVRRLDGMLDELLAGLKRPRPYLKLDTQGFDLDVFAGAGERIADFVGMQSEVALMEIYKGMARMPEALEAYEGAGFEIAALYPVSRQTRTARVLEYDCVMVRASAIRRPGSGARPRRRRPPGRPADSEG